MNPLWLNAAALAVAFLYCIYRTHRRITRRKHRQLSERVAYMLWVMAARADERETSLVRP
jgi:hypothetical protein